MRLLGTIYQSGAFACIYDTYVYKRTWLFDYLGAGADAAAGMLTAPAFGQDYSYYWGRNGFATETATAQALALSWTTGTATITARGVFSTVMARAGFDNRDAHGYGVIQMVSPMLTRWIFRNGEYSYFQGGIGIMRLRFTPEPHVWMLLGAGLSMLGLLYRANRRSR